MSDVVDEVQALSELIQSLPVELVDDMLADLSQRLNPASVDMLERVVGAAGRGWRRDPMAFAMKLGVRVPDVIQPFRHMLVLANAFRRAWIGESRFQVWNLPSQMQKSTSLQLGCLWGLDQDPSRRIIYTGYSNALCNKAAIFVRDQAREHADALSFQLKPDQQRADYWVTDQGGSVLGHGLHAALAGFPADFVIVDDPLENFEQAHSQQMRDNAYDEIVAVARLRLREGGALILAHARWHLDDPTGRLLAMAEDLGVEIEHISLPMLATSVDDPMGREIGEPLEPKRYSLTECKSRAAFLGSYKTAALEQQEPLPETGGEIKRDWWQWYTEAPPVFDQVVSSWDTKLKDKTGEDFVAGGVVGRVGGEAFVVDVMHGRFTFMQTKLAIALMSVRHPEVTKHVVENAGNGPEVMTELRASDPTFTVDDEAADKLGMTADERLAVQALIRRGMPGLVPNNATMNKVVRVRSYLSPNVEGHHVWLPKSRAFSNAIVDEAAAFPPKAGGHDDLVDMMSQAMKHLFYGDGGILQAPPHQLTVPHDRSPSIVAGHGTQGLPAGNARIIR